MNDDLKMLKKSCNVKKGNLHFRKKNRTGKFKLDLLHYIPLEILMMIMEYIKMRWDDDHHKRHDTHLLSFHVLQTTANVAPVVFLHTYTSVGILSLLLYITQIKSGQITNERERFLRWWCG